MFPLPAPGSWIQVIASTTHQGRHRLYVGATEVERLHVWIVDISRHYIPGDAPWTRAVVGDSSEGLDDGESLEDEDDDDDDGGGGGALSYDLDDQLAEDTDPLTDTAEDTDGR